MKWLYFIIIIFYGMAISSAFFERSGYGFLSSFLFILPLSLFSVYLFQLGIKHKRTNDYEIPVFGMSVIIVFKYLFFLLAENRLDPYPFDLFILILLTLLHPVFYAFLYGVTIIAINVLHIYTLTGGVSLAAAIYNACFIVLTVVFIEGFLRFERRAKKRAEGKLGGIETLATKISKESGKGFESSNLAISEDVKKDIFLDSAYRLSNALTRTIKTIQEMTVADSCCLFVMEDEKYKLCAAATEEKKLVYEVPRGKGRNLLSWIDEYDRPFRTDRASGRSLGYYSSDDGTFAFIGVPVNVDNSESRAILCADRKEGGFARDDENLLIMAANVAAEYLRNSAVYEQMRIETREFHAFYSLTKMLSENLDLDAILETSLNLSREIVNYDLSAIALKDHEGAPKLVKAKGEGEKELIDQVDDIDKGILGWVMEREKSFHYSRSVRVKKVFPELPDPLARMGSFLCLPLLIGNKAIGVFVTSRKNHKAYTTYEVKLFEALAAHVSSAVSNAVMYNKMESMAITDGLTGLYNHRYFQEKLVGEIERSQRYGEKFAQVLTDIDFFKKINDTYGHPAGDKILKDVSGIIRDSIRSIDFASRYGGEEFAVILVNADKKEALAIAQRIRTTVEGTAFDIGRGKKVRATLSIGISIYPGDANSKQQLISRADEALYLAKKEGRNRVYLYSEVRDRIEA